MPTRDDERPVICQVLHSLGIGGAEVLAAQIARRLSDRYRFVFACLDDLGTLGEQLQRDGFPVTVLHRQPGLDWRCAFRLADFVRSEHAQLIHAHQYTPFFQALGVSLVNTAPGEVQQALERGVVDAAGGSDCCGERGECVGSHDRNATEQVYDTQRRNTERQMIIV